MLLNQVYGITPDDSVRLNPDMASMAMHIYSIRLIFTCWYFQPEKLLFVVDWIVLGRMPWQKLWSYDIQGMINSTTQALELDFDVFVGGHADIGKKADVQRYLTYIQELYNAVIDGIHFGKSLEEMKQSIKLSSYSDIKQYEEWLPLNIEGVYERLMEESGMGWRPDIKQ